MHDVCRLNNNLYSKSVSLCEDIQNLYNSLSKKIFSLADVFNKISNNFKQLEKLEEEEFKDHKKISDSYNFFKITLYAWSNHYKMNSDAILKLITPYCEENLEDINQLKDVIFFSKNLDVHRKRKFDDKTHQRMQKIWY